MDKIEIVVTVLVPKGSGFPKLAAMDELRAVLEHHNAIQAGIVFDAMQVVDDVNQYALARD